MVIKYEVSDLVHIMSRDMSQESYKEVRVDLGIRYPEVLTERFTGYDELFQYLQETETADSLKSEGVIIKSDQQRYKIQFDLFRKMRSVLGNSWNKFYRYLEIRNDNELIDKYLEYFPEHREDFKGYEASVNRMCKMIHDAYIDFRVKRVDGYVVPDAMKTILYNLHGMYLNSHKPTTLQTVLDTVATLDTPLVCSLHNRIVV